MYNCLGLKARQVHDINDSDVCEKENIVKEYNKNINDAVNLTSLHDLPIALEFLKNALNQDLDTLLLWLGTHELGIHYSEKEDKAILYTRLVLTDFYANCNKPSLKNVSNERRTPFVEYFIPFDVSISLPEVKLK
ncbi:hypothetical protein BD408DRAFT_423747 [Parasitella parasitica]|nr:hypothetical protein BD408DRAFT_423747 [Parasitella parasitica]